MLSLAPHTASVFHDRIAVTRVVCICFMIYVHVPNGHGGAPYFLLDTAPLLQWVQALLIEGPGRASAALLSLVSGYLTARSLSRSGGHCLPLYRRRFKSIFLPMLIWAIGIVMVYAVISIGRSTFLDKSDAVGLEQVWMLLNTVVFITEVPVGPTVHLSFLRDLFVCILLAPLLLRALDRWAEPVLAILVVVYLVDLPIGIVLRPLILFAFTVGLLLSQRRVALDRLDRYAWIWIALTVLSAITIMLAHTLPVASALDVLLQPSGLGLKESVLYPLTRVFGALSIWTTIPWLLSLRTVPANQPPKETGSIRRRLMRAVGRIEPYLFATYCSHYLVLTVLYFAAFEPTFGKQSNVAFLIWFLLAPVTSLVMARLLIGGIESFSPAMATLLTGGRLRRAVTQVGSPMDSVIRPTPGKAVATARQRATRTTRGRTA